MMEDIDQDGHHRGSNRTFMELKLGEVVRWLRSSDRSNRTFMELKS